MQASINLKSVMVTRKRESEEHDEKGKLTGKRTFARLEWMGGNANVMIDQQIAGTIPENQILDVTVIAEMQEVLAGFGKEKFTKQAFLLQKIESFNKGK